MVLRTDDREYELVTYRVGRVWRATEQSRCPYGDECPVREKVGSVAARARELFADAGDTSEGRAE